MNYKKILIAPVVILIVFGIYYRDYIPTTRSDFINLYYFIFEKKLSGDVNKNSLNEIDLGLQPQPIQESDNNNSNQENNNNTSPKQKIDLPESVNNYVPFTSQAPLGIWDKFHEEACEEASLAMAHYFLDKRNLVLSKEAEKDIQYIGSKTKGGGMEDLTIEQLKNAAEQLYGYKNWKIIDKPNMQDFKRELLVGNIIIIPLAGREIGNPYYKQPGPLYHMLIINGYDNKKGIFITQDPGTKRGKDFTYKFNTLLEANHDFTGDKNKINQGVSRILVVVK